MIFTEGQIEVLLDGDPIIDEWPWVQWNEDGIERHIQTIIDKVKQEVGLLDETDYDHYGSGYASFVDCRLYRIDVKSQLAPGSNYLELGVLFSRLANYYVILGEAQKRQGKNGEWAYPSYFERVDRANHPATLGIMVDVCSVLNAQGLERLYAEELSEFLPKKFEVYTLLGSRPWRLFDALFYWMD